MRMERKQEASSMREILFKAKRIDNGEWVEGYYCIKKPYCFDNRIGSKAIIITEHSSTGTVSFEVNPDTICQYTGLTDKNGNKIWENDVVKYHFGDDVAPIRFGKYMSCFDSTKTAHIGFYVDWDDRTKPLRKDLGYWVEMIDCNVIGNIFDNPELLEGGV